MEGGYGKFSSIHLAQRAVCLVRSTGSQAAGFTGKEGVCSLLGYNHLFDCIIDYTASLLGLHYLISSLVFPACSVTTQ